jgi:uncharacterized membrane protein
MSILDNDAYLAGGLFIVAGAFALIRYRTRREKIVGLTYRRFAFCCWLAVVVGALIVVSGFFR